MSRKPLATLGLAEIIHCHADRVGCFRPIVESEGPATDAVTGLVRDLFEFDDSRAAAGMTRAEARELVIAGRTADIYSRDVAAH
ncbi:hypothetical protein [Paeniglutamicibacter cryotolerans]|uniref:hypothetical protein n=1 Tax=Paeniglutamicibacter cryotolerans TaxID=670079 RepID=UPI0031F1BF40